MSRTDSTSRGSTVALVESATQLLNVLEWARSADAAADTHVVVCLPRHENTRAQLRRMAVIAQSTGVRVEPVDLRRAAAGTLGAGARVVRDVARAERLVIGDPFSRLIQTLLPFGRPAEVVVVDDGTATWEYRACVDAQRPLLRWRLADQKATGRAARATRLLSPGAGREVTVFSCLADPAPVGARAVRNDYAWTRQRSTPDIRAGRTDIVGASLVETGIVDRAAYLAAVRQASRRRGPVRYLSHRKESPAGLALIAALPGVRVVRSLLPVELGLREGPVAEHLVTFPSTAAHTLPIVLADVPVSLEMRRAEPDWFTADSTDHARLFVDRIGDVTPRQPVPEVA